MIEPFHIAVDKSEIDDLRARLGNTRLPPAPAGEPWESGVDYGYLAELLGHWQHNFDWREQEARLNSVDQFTAVLSAERVHYVHVRADRSLYPNATPMILSHGWPYSFVEFLPIIPFLTDPLSSGGTVADAFDIVVPSLPGYGFSPPLAGAPFTEQAVADVWHALMTEELGYDRFATYGEDVGTGISDWLAASYPSSIIGLFATHAAFPSEARSGGLSEEEIRFEKWLRDKWKTSRGYSEIQATRPDTLSVGLNDSPAGLLAWLLEKFWEWSGPTFQESWSPDDILTTVSLYWFTRTIGSSFLPYYHGRLHEVEMPLVHVPVGVAVQWGERGFPREYAERTYTDVRTWTELPYGGHFTVKQDPELVASAMREFFAGLDVSR